MGKEEGIVEDHLAEQVKKLGGFSRKYVSPGVRGVPDRIVFLNQYVVFVEVKSSVGELSGAQKREKRRMQDAGACVAVVSSKKEVDKCLRTIMSIPYEIV